MRACWGHGGTALAASLAQSSGHLRAPLWCLSPASPSPAGVHSYSQTPLGHSPPVQVCKPLPLPGSFLRVPPSVSLHRRNVGPFSPAPCVRSPSNPGSSCPVHLLFDANPCSAPHCPPTPPCPLSNLQEAPLSHSLSHLEPGTGSWKPPAPPCLCPPSVLSRLGHHGASNPSPSPLAGSAGPRGTPHPGYPSKLHAQNRLSSTPEHPRLLRIWRPPPRCSAAPETVTPSRETPLCAPPQVASHSQAPTYKPWGHRELCPFLRLP